MQLVLSICRQNSFRIGIIDQRRTIPRTIKRTHEIYVLCRISDFYARKYMSPYIGSDFFKRLLLVGLPLNDGNVRGVVREVCRRVITAPWFILVVKKYHGAPTISIL